MKPEKIREMSADELRSKERELQEQLFRLRFQKSIGQLENTAQFVTLRKDIARLKTMLTEQKKAAMMHFVSLASGNLDGLKLLQMLLHLMSKD